MRKNVDIVNQQGEAAGSADTLELVHAVMHLVRARHFQALRDSPHGVTHMDTKVLGFFSRHPGATLSDLAQHSGRDKAQLARLVAGLRERGLLDGEADPADRRSVRLALTVQGVALQRSLRAQGKRLATLAVDGLSADEQAQLQALLLRLKRNLEAAG